MKASPLLLPWPAVLSWGGRYGKLLLFILQILSSLPTLSPKLLTALWLKWLGEGGEVGRHGGVLKSLALMLFDTAFSGWGRILKLIHFRGGQEHLCIFWRLPSKSGNLSSAVPSVFQQSGSS